MRSLLNYLSHVPYVFCAPRTLVPHVPHTLCALALYVPCALRALVPHISCAINALTCLVPKYYRTLRASHPACSRTLHASMCMCSCVSRASCFACSCVSRVSCTVCSRAPLRVLFSRSLCLMFPYALQVLFAIIFVFLVILVILRNYTNPKHIQNLVLYSFGKSLYSQSGASQNKTEFLAIALHIMGWILLNM